MMNVSNIKPESTSAKRYLGVAYERCTNGFPVHSDEYSRQQKIVDTFVMERPHSATALVFLAFVGAVISHPIKTFRNCLTEILIN